MTELNIVRLIEENPVTRLSNTYHSKLLNKIKETFTDDQQKMFVSSFYCYLNCNQKTDFIIDFDSIWEWLGFTQKVNAKRFLENNFEHNIDYKCLLFPKEEQTKCKGSRRGGHNKEIIMMTVKTFKLFCIKAGTKKSHQIHEYYMKLEETLQDLLEEESNELKVQLENKDKLLEQAEIQKELLRENTILEQFPDNVQCVYYGIIDDITSNNETLIKFGNSNFLRDRVIQHKKTFTNFRLVNAFKVENKTQIENAIKKNKTIIERRRTITIHNAPQTELLVRGQYTYDELDNLIKNIIISVEYSAENYKKLFKENAKLVKENNDMNKKIMDLIQDLNNVTSQKNTLYNITNSTNIDEANKNLTNQVLLLEEENKRLKKENIKFINKYKLNKDVDSFSNTTELTTNMSTINDIKYNSITNSMQRIHKSADGFYHIDQCKYKKCFGTRQEVWDGHAYKTTGELTKQAFMINKEGKIISKKKFIQEKAFNRFEEVNLRKKTH